MPAFLFLIINRSFPHRSVSPRSVVNWTVGFSGRRIIDVIVIRACSRTRTGISAEIARTVSVINIGRRRIVVIVGIARIINIRILINRSHHLRRRIVIPDALSVAESVRRIPAPAERQKAKSAAQRVLHPESVTVGCAPGITSVRI